MGTLLPRAVRHCRLPGYPTKPEVLAHPEVLARHVPPSWLARREIAGAVGVFLAANAAGCADRAAGDGSSAPRRDPRIAKAAVVAPLFEHGRGEDSSLNTVGEPAPPMYLPEEEALRVIVDELDRAGLQMSERHVFLNSVIIAGWERRNGYEWVSGQQSGFMPVEGPLELDLRDPVRRVAVEYVSFDNVDRLGGHGRGDRWLDFRGVSASVAEEVARQGRGVYFGAFYDPAVHLEVRAADADRLELVAIENRAENAPTEQAAQKAWQEWREKREAGRKAAEARTKLEARELLRQQVKDFVEWLKGQGVI